MIQGRSTLQALPGLTLPLNCVKFYNILHVNVTFYQSDCPDIPPIPGLGLSKCFTAHIGYFKEFGPSSFLQHHWTSPIISQQSRQKTYTVVNYKRQQCRRENVIEPKRDQRHRNLTSCRLRIFFIMIVSEIISKTQLGVLLLNKTKYTNSLQNEIFYSQNNNTIS